VRPDSLFWISQRKAVAFESLVTELARQEEVVPLVHEPVVTRILKWFRFVLSNAAFGPKVFDVPVADMGDLGFTEGAFVILSHAEGRFHIGVRINCLGE
jgi:hypothetical protein